MYIKPVAISLALAQISGMAIAAGSIQEYWKSFRAGVDPHNITLPKIPQTTSYDGVAECTYYTPPAELQFKDSEWPTPWLTATSNGMNTSAEFKALYNSIDWTKAPNIPVRQLLPDGSVDMSKYDEANDPDCWWSATTCTKPKHQNVNEDIYACPEPDTWGLTYDDGPNCSHNAFYDYLEEQKLKATMFYIGSNVVDWPYGAMRGMKDGHHIADHTWSHQLMTTLNNQEVLAELYYTQKAIKLTTGVTPRHWRPAFGDVDDRVRWIATQLNLTTILWNLDTDDWAAGSTKPLATVQQSYDDFIQMGSNGTFGTSGNIVLTHEIDNTTMQLAVENLPKIQKAYTHVLDVATCMNITHPYMEDTVTVKTFDEVVGGKKASTSGAASSAASASSQPSNGVVKAASASGSLSSSSSSSSADASPSNSAAFQVSPNMAAMAVMAALAIFI
ncbi:chitin deacetylase [Radiomyces spectabilis]|uniref:chitin deacetylase n=1 Tax=Radiomyces spectabilis TaxID=64574 RepID=UPI00222009A5|nr:chitin deacetylase [Radiomyces spectabilis]KAI8391656.1 chitin deacetylase [Radiomyces spectabilis]